jgi:hypothetical protein
MTVPADHREGTLAAANAAYESLWAVVEGLTEAEGTRTGVVGDWSALQVLAHTQGWLGQGELAMSRMARGERPQPERTGYSNVDAWNAKFVEVHAQATLAEALAAFASSFAGFREALAALPEERFGAGRTATAIATMSCINHFAEHQAEIVQGLRG